MTVYTWLVTSSAWTCPRHRRWLVPPGGAVMDLAYTNCSNVDARFGRPYERGDRLVRGHRGTIDVELSEPIEASAERLLARHNADDRPDGQRCPSMSVGDVVVIGEMAVSVDVVGWCRVAVDAADVIVDRSWPAVVAEPKPPGGDAARQVVTGWSSSPPPMPTRDIGPEWIG